MSPRLMIGLAAATVLVVAAGLVALLVVHGSDDDGPRTRANYRTIEALRAGQCFVPTTDNATDDRAIESVQPCTDPSASVRVTGHARTPSACPQYDRNGVGALPVLIEGSTRTQSVVCVAVNMLLRECYVGSDTTVFLNRIDCETARRSGERYYRVLGRVPAATVHGATCGRTHDVAFAGPTPATATCARLEHLYG